MPNWVSTKIEVFAPSKIQLVQAIEAVLSKDDEKGNPKNHISFNTIIPAPEDNEGWYEWNCENWGTKWDACHTNEITRDYILQNMVPKKSEVMGDGFAFTVEFATAWSFAAPFVQEWSVRFPDVQFTASFYDEDYTANYGKGVWFGKLGKEGEGMYVGALSRLGKEVDFVQAASLFFEITGDNVMEPPTSPDHDWRDYIVRWNKEKEGVEYADIPQTA